MMMTLNHKARIFQGAMEETLKDQEAPETRRDPTSAPRSKTINTFQRSNSLWSHPARRLTKVSQAIMIKTLLLKVPSTEPVKCTKAYT